MSQSVRDSALVREQFASLLEHCPFPTLIVHPDDFEILAANARVASAPGAPASTAIGAEFTESVRKLQLAPGDTRTLYAAAAEPGAPRTALHISCDELHGEPVYILVVQTAEDLAPGRTESRNALRAQEMQFRALADAVPVGIFLTNADGRVMYVNDKWSALTGASINTVMLRGWLDGVHVDDRMRVQHAWNQLLTESRTFDIEFRYTRASETLWIAVRAVPFMGEKGKRAGYLGTFTDLTSRKAAEERLSANEARYRRMFENIIDVYYETSLTGEILEVSPSIEALGTFSRQELLGRSMLEFYADQSARGRLLAALVERGGLHDYEVELKDKTGLPIPCAISCKLEMNEHGEPVKIIGSMRDIRQRKAVEDMLRAERESLELIAQGQPLKTILEAIVHTAEAQAPGMICSILTIDPDGKRFRLGAAPSLPDDYNAAIDGLEFGPEVGSCGHAAATKSTTIVEDISVHPYWNDYKALALPHGLRACWSQPILGTNGRLLGTFAMYYTQPGKPQRHHVQLIAAASQLAAIALERARAQEEQLNFEAQMRQTQKLESLGVLAGGIAHDFNNLLTGIMGYASLASYSLKDSNLPAERHVREIEKVAQRAADLTKQMLAYSGKGRFLVMPLNLSEVVEELAHLLEISISKKARIHYDFSANLPLVEADPAQVQQVVMNLITNASEALGDQPGDIRIATGIVNAKREYLAGPHLDAELPEGDYVFVEVTDTGCGMDKETIARIFDPFFTTKFTGRGLGMSAVLGIMRGHRGTIKIDSTPGAGTTIRLLFPASAKLQKEPDSAWSNRVVTREDHQAQGTILIVDDEEMVRNIAATILAEAGYRVLTAVDGVQALEIFTREHKHINLILLDLTMPNKDGIETLHEIRAQGSAVPVVLSSGYTEVEVKKRINGDRFEAFIQKPYTRESMLAGIEDVLARAERA